MAYTPSFVNFSRYLDANRNTAASQAQGLADSANQQGADVEGRLNSAVTDFNQNAQVAQGLGPGGNLVDPTGAIRRTYSGPSSLAEAQGTGYDTLLSDAQAAQDKAGDLGSEGGLRTTLQARQGSSPYTAGASRFDAGLISTAGQPALSDAASRYSNLAQRIRDSNTASQDAAAAAKATSDANSAAYRAQLGNPLASGSTAPAQQSPYTMANRPSFLPETKEQAQSRAVSPLGYFNSGATAKLQDTLQNYNTYRQTAEDAWRRNNYNPFGRDASDANNPYTAEHVGKRRPIVGTKGWQ